MDKDWKKHFNYLKPTVRYYLQPPEWLKLKRLRITSIGEKAEQIEHFSWECKMA